MLRFNSYKPKKKRTLLFRIVRSCIFIIAICTLIYFAIDFKLRPIIRTMGTANAKAIATRAIYDAVNSELDKDDIKYDDLITLEKNSENRVTALRTNMIKMNKLKARLSVSILNKITSIEESTIRIPLGNIIDGEALSGQGPKISFKIVPVGTVTADMINVFQAAGINQTRHQIILQVKVTVGVIMPNYSTSAEVSTAIPIAETVIIGEVPPNYTNVEGDPSSMLEKINNYVKNKDEKWWQRILKKELMN